MILTVKSFIDEREHDYCAHTKVIQDLSRYSSLLFISLFSNDQVFGSNKFMCEHK